VQVKSRPSTSTSGHSRILCFQLGKTAESSLNLNSNKKPKIAASFDIILKIKGLVAACHSFCLFFIFYNIHIFVHSITFIQYIYPSPFAEASLHFLIACLLIAKPRIELGPALQQVDAQAQPTEPCRTKEPCRTNFKNRLSSF
jgi:hypothetical protein